MRKPDSAWAPFVLLGTAAQEDLVDDHGCTGPHGGRHAGSPGVMELPKRRTHLDPTIGQEANAVVGPYQTGRDGVEQHVDSGAQPGLGKNRLQAPGDGALPGTRSAVEDDNVVGRGHGATVAIGAL
jgi:hypothetical protein